MYRVYNLRPQPAPANWARDNKPLLVGLVFWSLFLAGIAGSQQVSSEGWYIVTSLEGALVTLRMPSEKSCKADVAQTCVPGYKLRAQPH
ncbi:hypothetical protein [Pseudomonas viridiflava]|uniref:hypothetical protein n=1 Tax=Pseudomonas viridiflava TaxID=33069 RepID=UPI000F01BE5E|nr:hypothetical protein [Pseudomonas viridiflava]MEE4637048.1 hypothetical protein [Pseudomonas alliivorans]MEE4948106.1 hypothetical protein [Pseudomonas alliivorans]